MRQLISRLRANAVTLAFVAGVLFVRGAIANQYVIPSGSMLPTIEIGDHVLVNRVAYDFKIPLTDISMLRIHEPKRGDIVVFDSPVDGQTLIKRLIAVPGDRVRIENGFVWINGAKISDETHARRIDEDRLQYSEHLESADYTVQRIPSMARAHKLEFAVPEDQYFFMGDNRDNSHDSRAWGFAPRRLLAGRANLVLYSFDGSKPLQEKLNIERIGHRLE